MGSEETLSKQEIINLIEEGDRYAGAKFEEIKGNVETVMETYEFLKLRIDGVDAKLQEFRGEVNFKLGILSEGQDQLFVGQKQLFEGQSQLFIGQKLLFEENQKFFEELRAMRKEFSERFDRLEEKFSKFEERFSRLEDLIGNLQKST